MNYKYVKCKIRPEHFKCISDENILSYDLCSCCSSVEGHNPSPARPTVADVAFRNLGAACPEKGEGSTHTRDFNTQILYSGTSEKEYDVCVLEVKLHWYSLLESAGCPHRPGDHSPLTINLTINIRQQQNNYTKAHTIIYILIFYNI